MLTLPMRLFFFWYRDGVIFFLKLLSNLIQFLEEDLAVGLMARLLFQPLFHDSSIVGRIMSFLFRLTRIIVGVAAMGVTGVVVGGVLLLWVLVPLLGVVMIFMGSRDGMGSWGVNIVGGVLLVGLACFFEGVFFEPRMKVWQIKKVSDVWFATKLKKKDLTWINLLKDHEVVQLLKLLELDSISIPDLSVPLSDELLIKVWELAKKDEAHYITSAYFFVAMVVNNPSSANELLKLNLSHEDLIGTLKYIELRRAHWRAVMIWEEDFNIRHLKGVNRGWLNAPTPLLDTVATDLTREAAKGGFGDFVGRVAALNQVVSILSQTTDRNVLLVGKAGTGKSALVKYLAKMIVRGEAPESLATKRLVSLDLSRLLSGASTQGALAEKVKNVFEEVKFSQNIIIFVDEIHNLGTGDAGNELNVSSLLLPYLESGEFQFIGSTEPDNYARIIEKNTSFARIFHKVTLEEATPEETMQIVQQRAIDLARYKKIQLTYLAMKQIVTLSDKYIHDRMMPDAALSLMDECQTKAKDGWITTGTVKEVVSADVKVPVLEVNNDKKDLLLHLEGVLKERFVGQEEAVKQVASTLRRSATSVREEGRPIGSFLFVGPSGVGKTELAKTLAAVYFDQDPFIQFDMSEYQSPESVNRLLGTTENPGELTEAVKNRPYALLLLDEFEKANPQILTLFLQVLEEGRLTDASGRQTDFTNTIIIATSNAGSLVIAEGIKAGEPFEGIKLKVHDELLKMFKPELVNRFDDCVIFTPLDKKSLEQIVRLKLTELTERMKKQGYMIEFSPDIISTLVEKGYDPLLGARPLRRLIQDTLESKLSVMILEGKLPKGQIITIPTL